MLLTLVIISQFVLVDSSRNGYTLWGVNHQSISYNSSIDRLILVNRTYNPSGALNTHSAPGDLSFWFHDLGYNQGFGAARYPSALAGHVPYLSFPALFGNVWAGFSVIKYNDWFNPLKDSIFISIQGVMRANIKQLVDNTLIVIATTNGNSILFWTLTPSLDSIIASGTIAESSYYIGFDINDGVGIVSYFGTSDMYYRYTTDGVTWSSPIPWNFQFNAPYPGYIMYHQMAVTDNGEPLLVFDYRKADDITYPYYGHIYVARSDGSPAVDLTASLPDTEAMYPSIACEGNYAAIIFNLPRNNLDDGQAWMDIWMAVFTDNGITWSLSRNITEWSNSRIGLQQIAQRIDLMRERIYYIFAVDKLADIDPYWHLCYGTGTDPM